MSSLLFESRPRDAESLNSSHQLATTLLLTAGAMNPSASAPQRPRRVSVYELARGDVMTTKIFYLRRLVVICMLGIGSGCSDNPYSLPLGTTDAHGRRSERRASGQLFAAVHDTPAVCTNITIGMFNTCMAAMNPNSNCSGPASSFLISCLSSYAACVRATGKSLPPGTFPSDWQVSDGGVVIPDSGLVIPESLVTAAGFATSDGEVVIAPIPIPTPTPGAVCAAGASERAAPIRLAVVAQVFRTATQTASGARVTALRVAAARVRRTYTNAARAWSLPAHVPASAGFGRRSGDSRAPLRA